jgi:hypothetical protein
MNLKECRKLRQTYCPGMGKSMKNLKIAGVVGEILNGNLPNNSKNRNCSVKFLGKTVCRDTYKMLEIYKLLDYCKERRYF